MRIFNPSTCVVGVCSVIGILAGCGGGQSSNSLPPSAAYSVETRAASANHISPGTLYDAWKNWSFSNNPNPPWSYVYNGNTLLPFSFPSRMTTVPGPQPNNPCPVFGLTCWTNGQLAPTEASVFDNATNSTISFLTIKIPKNYLSLDPQSNPYTGNVAVQFAAPAGPFVYYVAGNFRGVDLSEAAHNVEVDASIGGQSLQLFSGQISLYGQTLPFKLKLCLNSNDSVSFVVDSAGSAYLSTGLKATVVSAKRCKTKKR
jgi:hypothetical protein